jgi:predicted Fe-Mo cluster-binding NifX family protein
MSSTNEHEQNDFQILAKPAQRALAGAGYRRLQQLTRVPESEVAELHGIGPNALSQLRDALAARGWSFAPEQDN